VNLVIQLRKTDLACHLQTVWREAGELAHPLRLAPLASEREPVHQSTEFTERKLHYLAHPYSSWERGLNEQVNGLVRQYFPKRHDFATITADDLTHVMERLNNRPRKTLGYKTPNEVYFKRPLIALTT